MVLIEEEWDSNVKAALSLSVQKKLLCLTTLLSFNVYTSPADRQLIQASARELVALHNQHIYPPCFSLVEGI